jgi:hypothetical protein
MQTLNKRLPADPRFMEGCLHVDQLVALVSAVMARSGQRQAMPFVMRNPAPIAFSVNRVSDTAQEVHVILPTELIVSVREALAPLLQIFLGGVAEQMVLEMPPDDSSERRAMKRKRPACRVPCPGFA